MSSPVNCQGPSAACLILSGLAVLVISAIVLLVLGILGANGTIAMAPVGANAMIGISVAMIFGMISGVIKACCRA